MRIDARLITIALLMLAFTVLPTQAQYSEIYKLDRASNGLDEKIALTRLSEQLAIPLETLEHQKSKYLLSLGQLFMAHALAKAANRDAKSGN